jgi:vancomycin permeability regulator SanA
MRKHFTITNFINSFLALTLIWVILAYSIIAEGLDSSPKKSDIIVVFGTEILPTGEPSRLLKWRLNTASAHYHDLLADKIFVSGGIGESGFNEAQIMSQYLQDLGIPIENIVVDEDGYDSMRTVLNSVGYMNENEMSSVLVISDYTHIKRIKLLYSLSNINNVSSDYSDIPMLSDLTIIVRESLAYISEFSLLFRK